MMLSTDGLKLRYGSKVKVQHKVALKQLTKILNRDHTQDDEPTGPSLLHSTPVTTTELSRTRGYLQRLQNTAHLHLSNILIAKRTALELLRQYQDSLEDSAHTGKSINGQTRPEGKQSEADDAASYNMPREL